MAITLITQPQQFGRIHDTNRLTYRFYSDNFQLPNFQFQFELIYWDPTGLEYIHGGYNFIGLFNKFPDYTGTTEFNPGEIYKNYLTYDFDASITGFTEAVDSAGKFQLTVYEYYGEPPVRNWGNKWSGESGTNIPMMLYNGVQMNIPYDYIKLNPQGNNYWVMNKFTTTPVGENWNGHYLTDFNEASLSNDDMYYLYFLGEKDRAFYAGRPTKIRYKYTYLCKTGGIEDTQILTAPIGGLLGITNQLNTQPNLNRPLVTGPNTIYLPSTLTGDTAVIGIDPNAIHIFTCTGVSYVDVQNDYKYDNSLMYYFPCGPYYIDKTLNWFNNAQLKASWITYDVDIMSGDTLLNATPFRVFKNTNKCGNKYGKYRIAWLNQHGGFDMYSFTSKSQDNFKTETFTYKKKMTNNTTTFSTYEAGERIYDKNIKEEITLRTDNLTQKEAQSLMNLIFTTRAYVVQIYTHLGVEYVYGVPIIVTTNDINYPTKKNEKEIYMEIKIRYANDRITQRD